MREDIRHIQKRWFITGQLELLTPTHLSNGDADPGVDLPIVTDPLEGRALLTGASLAGALRHYLNSYLGDYIETDKGRAEKPTSRVSSLFGGIQGNDEGEQSALIVSDALGEKPHIELRDGVRIDPATRTAADQAKYDLQLLAAGTTFPLGFELVITKAMDEAKVVRYLGTALSGLQTGQIALGGRKQRGFGACIVKQWQVWEYDLTQAADLKAWLAHDRSENWWATQQRTPVSGDDILTLLKIQPGHLPPDQRQQFQVEATLAIQGSLLIRSGFEQSSGPDVAHLKSRRPGEKEAVPVLSGTSLAGVMRGQALRIARTLAGTEGKTKADELVDGLFGIMAEKHKRASRVRVGETKIEGDYRDLVQSRVRIDRFTGGAFESALFEEQPVFGGVATLSFHIDQPQDAEIGLLLLVLKDLWTGFTPVGGSASVGRGRLQGQSACLVYHHPTEPLTWELNRLEGQLAIKGDKARLEQYVQTFVTYVRGGKQ